MSAAASPLLSVVTFFAGSSGPKNEAGFAGLDSFLAGVAGWGGCVRLRLRAGRRRGGAGIAGILVRCVLCFVIQPVADVHLLAGSGLDRPRHGLPHVVDLGLPLSADADGQLDLELQRTDPQAIAGL